MLREALGILGDRQFRLLFLGRTVSLFGSAFAPIALAFAVLDLTGSAGDLGLVVASGVVPQVISSSSAGSGQIGCRGTT